MLERMNGFRQYHMKMNMRMRFDYFYLTAFFSILLLSVTSCREGYNIPFYIGCLEDAEPYSYRNANGEITGLEVDMIQAAADYYGIWVSFVPTTYDDIHKQLRKRNHKIDGAAAMIPWTMDRMEDFSFITPSYMTTSFCFAVSDEEYATLFDGDMEGRTLAVKSGSLAEGYALDHLSEWGCTLDVFDTFKDEIESVLSGESDLLLEDRFLVEYHINHNGAQLFVVDKGIPNIVYGFVTGKDQDKTLRRDIQAGLEGIFENGTAQEIILRYSN